MSNKFTQPVDGAVLEEFLATAGENPKALILSAYLEEKQKWDKLVQKLSVDRFDQIKIITEIGNKLEIVKMEADQSVEEARIESGFGKFVNNLFGFKTAKQKHALSLIDEAEKLQEEYNEAEDKFNKFSKRLQEIATNPPSVDMWELAIMGNNLFSTKR